jgi:predicted pyridoxine 5'-phosphate oxidase superfamily flavin-nucleotide-binding protein
MERELAAQVWLAGAAPSIADVACYAYIAHAPEGGIALAPYPQVGPGSPACRPCRASSRCRTREAAMNDDRIAMPFHAGELRAQRLAGAAPAAAPIRARMPEQHRAFFPLLRFVCVAVPDADGWPLATLVEGPPGFASSPDPGRLVVGAMPAPDDPVRARLLAGAPAGLLGIDLATRRRNRLNGVSPRWRADGFAVDVVQSFGNCPRYIQVRELAPVARTPGAAVSFGTELAGAGARDAGRQQPPCSWPAPAAPLRTVRRRAWTSRTAAARPASRGWTAPC